MKKLNIFLSAGLAIIALAACNSVKTEIESVSDSLVPMTFSASVDGIDTKTALDSEFRVLWSTDDHITVFAGENASGSPFDVESVSSEKTVATFSGLSSVSTTYYALFPAQSDATISAGKIAAEFPTAQTAVEGSFGPTANLGMAMATGDELQFKNVGAIVGLTVDDASITSIRLEGLGANDYLSGKGTIDYNGGEPAFTVTEGKNYVQMSGTFAAGKTYYFVVLPGTYANGFKVTFTKPGYTMTAKNTTSATIARNGNVLLGSFPVASNWKANFTPGEDIFIKGLSEAENGQKVTYISDGYYPSGNTDFVEVSPFDENSYNYEVFASVKASEKVYFEAADGELFAINGESIQPVSSISEATTIASEDGIYRIRFNMPAGNAYVQKVTSVGVFYSASGTNSMVNLTYDAKGVWKMNDFTIRWKNMGSWNDERYKFSFTIDGTKQQFGRMHSSGNRPNAETEAAYWDLAPSKTSDWDPGFKMPNQWLDFNYNNRWTVDLTLYMTADHGHYTHVLDNPVDHYVAPGAPLYIGGEGSEAGQQFTWLDSNYYDSDAKAANPSFDPEEGLYGYYEIYTKLEAGKSYYFYTDNIKYNPTTLEQAADAAAASSNVAEGGIYRIRVDLDGKRVGLKKIEKFLMAYEWNRQDPNWQWEFTYAGKGTWKIDDFTVVHHDYDKPARYNFHMLFGDFNNRQVWGRNQALDGQPAADAAQSVFDLQPRETREWPGREMKFPVNVWDNDNSGRYTVDITVYFNTEKGHYTHTFTDITDTL